MRGWLYLETSFKHGDPVAAAASWGDAKRCGTAARTAVAAAWRKVPRSNWWPRGGWGVLLPAPEFWGVLLPILPQLPWGPGEILRRFGPVAPGQLRTRHCSKAMERQKKKKKEPF